MKSSVSVSELKASISKYIRRVKRGEEVLVTDRGKLVARLLPIPAETAQSESLQELAKQGIIRLPIKSLPKDFWDRPRPVVPDGTVERIMEEEREDRV